MHDPAYASGDTQEQRTIAVLRQIGCAPEAKVLMDYLDFARATQARLDAFQANHDQQRENRNWQDVTDKLVQHRLCSFVPQDRFDAHWQAQALRNAGLIWQFTWWRAPMENRDQHEFIFGYTNRGMVRRSTG